MNGTPQIYTQTFILGLKQNLQVKHAKTLLSYDSPCSAEMLESYQNILNMSVGLNDLFSKIWQEGYIPQTCFNILINLLLNLVFRINQVLYMPLEKYLLVGFYDGLSRKKENTY